MDNNDNIKKIKDNNSQNGEEKNTNNNEHNKHNNKSNNTKELIFNQVTRSDLILFKEDFLKTIKEFKTELNLKIAEKYEFFNKLIEESNQKVYNYEKDKNTFIQKLNFLEEKHEILSKISEKTTKLKNDLNVHTLLIQNCQKDISNMGFKYDKIITNNLMIPGLIGHMCKFNNLKEYILNNREEISEINNNIQSVLDELKLNKKKLDEVKDYVQLFKKNVEPTLQSFVDLKVNQLEKKMEKNLETIAQNIQTVHIENMAYVKNFVKKEQLLDEYLVKMEDMKKNILENNQKMIEKIKNINNFTLTKLEKEISETANIKKSVLDLANIFAKQKRSYGDDNLNDNKREVILTFSNMINKLIRDLNNDKKIAIKNISPFRKFSENEDIDDFNKKEYIDANSIINKNVSRKGSKKLTERLKNIYSSIRIKNYLNDINDSNKQNNLKEKKSFPSNQMFSDKNINIHILNKNRINSSSQKKINNINNANDKDNNTNHNDDNNINDSTNFLKISNNFSKEKNININIINDKNEITSYNTKNNRPTINKNNDIIEHISENYNYNTNIESKNEDITNIPSKINNLKDIKKYISSPKHKSVQIKKNIFRKEANNLSNTDRIMSRNNNLNNLKNLLSNKDNSKENNMIIYTERLSSNSKEKKFSIINETQHLQSGDSNINKIQKFQESASQSNSLFLKKNKKEKVKDIIINNISKIKKPFSKVDNNKENINNNKIFTSITHRKQNNHIDYIINRDIEDNKEIYYDKNIENKINYIKDKDIIDKPLIYNHTNFEINKDRSSVENKILELEYFTKKKFDELVKEIKNFIPIHFNSYLRDYSIVEIRNKHKIRKYL